jgi:20S proteasome alpha/beta subunit
MTGTSVLGLKYKDGVMLAADSLGVFDMALYDMKTLFRVLLTFS